MAVEQLMLIDALVNVQTGGVSFSLNEHIIRRFKDESFHSDVNKHWTLKDKDKDYTYKNKDWTYNNLQGLTANVISVNYN